MSNIINWVCLICVGLLIGEIMTYFCKDAIKVMNESNVVKVKKLRKVSANNEISAYENKIAK